MKLDDYVRALTAALALRRSGELMVPETSGVSLIPRVPGHVSLAGRTVSGEVVGFAEWLGGLPADVPRDVRSWVFETVHAPQFAFVPADFVALMDAQVPRQAIWERLYHLVRESAEMNGEPEVRRDRIRDTLLNADNGWWDMQTGQLLQEAQIECLVEGSQFVVPPALEPLFAPMEPLFPEDDRFSVYLYPLGPVTVAQLLALAAANAGSEKLGAALEAETAEGFSDFEGQEVSGGLEWLRTRTDGEAETMALGMLVCRAISRLCEEAGKTPVIPPELGTVFGPDERDQKRARFRGAISGAGLAPTLNPELWSCYVWEVADLGVEAADFEAAVENFALALILIEEFARKHESSFAEAFFLALFCLDLEPGIWQDPTGIRGRLVKAGISETAMAVFDANIGSVAELSAVGWPADRMGTVLAAAVADVFGGMGSWNDQDFDGDQEYGSVSGALAGTLHALWQALLAPWETT